MKKARKTNKVKTALLEKRTGKYDWSEDAKAKLRVEDFMSLKELKMVPKDVTRDHKKLLSFLEDLHKHVNRLIRGSKEQTVLTANELVARPTYAEEFQNIRDNMHKVVAQGSDGAFSDVASQLSHRSKMSVP